MQLITQFPLAITFPAQLPDVDVKAIICLVHSLYWLLIVNASIIRRRKLNQPESFVDPSTREPVAQESSITPQGPPALFLTSATYGIFYILLAIWWVNPNNLGFLVFQPTLPIQALGIAVLCLALVVKVWAFWVFRSWRLFPHIDPGHQLVTKGPYSFVRHPLYFAFQLLFFGSFLIAPRLGFLLQVIANFLAHDFRCRVEEKILTQAFDSAYKSYKKRTRRLLPWVY
ncbi:MAG TPA: isoprenylcysteine carboxylmethyltransferase family protein [Trichormus sp. M33_DOE_039]|nr:isoprenylcysteine carboxylmethyltransferase family protein [Trichormus sp. M33_DOE_039]